MKIVAYDPYPNNRLDVEYVSIETAFQKSDVITLHCPLTPETKHIVQAKTIELMKEDVYLINTSRGDLIRTEDLIEGLLNKKFAGVALDVYDEEGGVFYEDRSNDIIYDQNLARLATFPNVLITSHMGFFTKEAVRAIAEVTLANADAVQKGLPLENIVLPPNDAD
jgi:D-lactate dehydrogenase